MSLMNRGLVCWYIECCHRVKSWLLCRGIDYMLQAKLADARAQEAEQKLEG